MTAIFEPVEVIAYFKNLELKIIKFKRNNTIFKVSSTISKWKDKKGDNPITHFIVHCGKQDVTCELAYYHNDWKWELLQIN